MRNKTSLSILFTLFIFVNFVNLSLARPVDRKAIEHVSRILLHEVTHTALSGKQFQIKKITTLKDSASKIFANLATLEPKGFIVLSNNTEMEPVIAYSLRNDWPDDSLSSSSLFNFIRQDLRLRGETKPDSERIAINERLWQEGWQRTRTRSEGDFVRQWPEPGTTSTGGWIETTWHQGTPYNDFCPIDPNTNVRSYTGCVATAMAQILNYHQSISTLNFTRNDSYFSANPAIEIDADSSKYNFPSFARLNTYLHKIEQKYNSGEPLNDQDKAALNFACGIAVGMRYASNNSYAYVFDVEKVLTQRLGYSARVIYFSDENFSSILKTNMMNGYPAQISISRSTPVSGHSVVADGYNSSGFFHLNFGWGENSPDEITDAWYHLPESMGAGYDIIDYAVADIRPLGEEANSIVVNSSFHQFKKCRLGQYSTPEIVQLKNEGETPIQIDFISVTDHFFISTPTGELADSVSGFTIPAKDSADIQIIYSPTEFGPIEGDCIVSYNAGRQFLDISLRGYGVPQGGTIVNAGQVSGEWDKSGSPYYVCGDITLAPGRSLKVTPGVRVVFGAHYQFKIDKNSQLLAQGALNDSIYFTPWNKEKGWAGFYFLSSGKDDSLDYCVIKYAKNDHKGGAFSLLYSSPFIAHCNISENYGAQGGALYLYESSPRIINTLVFKNSAEIGGAIYGVNSKALLKNVTLADNTSNEQKGAISLKHRNNLTFENCIIWNDDSPGDALISARSSNSYADSVMFSYCDIDTVRANWLNQADDSSAVIFWKGSNIALRPGFENPGAGDYSLSANSPCIDAGDPLDDVGDENFPHGYRINLGAFGGTSAAAQTIKTFFIASPDHIDFGRFLSPVEKDTTIILKNGSNNTIHITEISCSDSHYAVEDNSGKELHEVTLLSGEIDSVKIIFSYPANAPRSYDAVLIFKSQECDDKIIPLAASSSLEGLISGVFVKENSPYFVSGDIAIADGKSLILLPGTVFKFLGNYQLIVGKDAQLQAVGTAQDSIVFCAENPAVGWGGIRIDQSGDDDELAYCIIKGTNNGGQGNESNGGAIQINYSSPFIQHSSITNNKAAQGGAIYASNSNFKLANCILQNNTASSGGALWLWSGKPEIKNIIFANNFSQSSGTIMARSTQALFANITMTGNSGYKTGGFSFEGKDTVSIKNSILWNNGPIVLDNGTTLDIRYCDVDTTSASWIEYSDGSPLAGFVTDKWPGIISVDPMFVNPAQGNYRLQPDSPCIDAGDPDDSTRAEPFPHGFRINMGAFGGTENAALTKDYTLTVTPDPIEFGDVGFDTYKELTLYLKNGSAKTIHLIDIASNNPKHFAITFFRNDQQAGDRWTFESGKIDSFKIVFSAAEKTNKNYTAKINFHTQELGNFSIPAHSRIVGGTRIDGGPISGILEKDKSPYLIDGDLKIEKGNSLVIEPGVTLQFMDRYGLTVGHDAKLLARGSITDSIRFCPYDTAWGWSGIHFVNSSDDDTLDYVSITHCKGNSEGGALEILASSPSISHSLLAHNTAKWGGAIALDHSSPVFKNILIHSNLANQDGGAIQCINSQPVFINATIVQNLAHSDAGALDIRGSSRCLFKNSIIWQNKSMFINTHITTGSGAVIDFKYCNIDTLSRRWIGGFLYEFDRHKNLIWGAGNICKDPEFVQPEKHNFSLRSTSPCVDGGNPSDDVVDEIFPHGYCRNMGAFGGTPLAARTNSLTMTVAPGAVNFGDVKVGSREQILLYLKNGSPGTIHVTDIVSSDAEHFSIQPVDGNNAGGRFQITLGSGAIMGVIVEFSTNDLEEKLYTAQISISSTELPMKILDCHAQTRFGTKIESGEVAGIFAKGESPYNICGDISVAVSDSLIIEPGVSLRFMGKYRLTVGDNAKLRAIGTVVDSIYFFPQDTTEGWRGITISNSGADDKLDYCKISYCNIKDYKSGATAIFHSSPSIFHSTFSHNKGAFGGPLYLENASPQINNALFMKNETRFGGGAITGISSVIHFENATITNNHSGKNGGGIYLENGSQCLLKNSILYNNSSASQGRNVALGEHTAINFTYSDVDTSAADWIYYRGENASTFGNCNWGVGNISTDPLFTLPLQGDFTLQQDSPCIDAGDPNENVGDEPFPHGYRLNLGAYGGTINAQKTNHAALAVSPNPLDFGNVGKELEKERVLYLKNGSPAAVHLNAVTSSDSIIFSCKFFSDNPSRLLLETGEIDSIKIKFTAPVFSDSIYSAQIVLSSEELPSLSIPLQARVTTTSGIDGGRISGVLTVDKSPYFIYGPLEVENGETLQIDPGVVLYFQKNCGLTVGDNARLLAFGRANDSIRFCPVDTSLGWLGISFKNSADDDTLAYCSIANCKGTTNGGGIDITSSSPTLAHLRISKCVALDAGGALYVDNGSLLITNSLLCNNKAQTRGGAIYAHNASLTLVNATIAQNQSFAIGGAVFAEGKTNATFMNSILWGNEADYLGSTIYLMGSEAEIAFRFSDVDTLSDFWLFLNHSSYSWAPPATLNWGSGNIVLTPRFEDADAGNFTLKANSPCIDAGKPDSLLADIEDPENPGMPLWPARGELRNDMGAFGGGSHQLYTKIKSRNDAIKLPTKYALLQNYPNPFNPETTIEFQLPQKNRVTLTIYNTLGQTVRILVAADFSAGTHRIIWDGRDNYGQNVGTGMYFYRMETTSFQTIRKMILLR